MKFTLKDIIEQQGIYEELERKLLAKLMSEHKEYMDMEMQKVKGEFLDAIKFLKGEKGDTIKGDTPVLGIDYQVPNKEELIQEVIKEIPKEQEMVYKIVRLIPKPKDGEDGKTPQKGIDYFDGKTPVAGIDFPLPKNGENGLPDTGKEIVEKLNSLPMKYEFQIDANHIRNLPRTFERKRFGRGTGNPLQLYDLSASLDGSTKIFTIPANKRVVLITSSSTPYWFRPTVDYTLSGTDNVTLTFDTAIDAAVMLASGQSLGVQYIE